MGKKITQNMHIMKDSILTVTTQDRDFGVTVDSSQKTPAHCSAAVKKGNKMLGVMEKGTVMILCFIYTHLYIFGSLTPGILYPHLKKTRRTGTEKGNKDDRGVEGLPHEKRLNRLGLKKKKNVFVMGQTEVYKLLSDAQNANRDLLFIVFHNTRTRKYNIKLLDSSLKLTSKLDVVPVQF